MIPVTTAYRTPMQGETVLRLADGRAVHQHPWLQDRLFDTLQAALDHCSGTTWQSAGEFIAWADGYNTQSLVDLIAAQLERFDDRDEFLAVPTGDNAGTEWHLIAIATEAVGEPWIYYALPILRALEALPDTAGYHAILQAMQPYIFEE